MESLLCKLGEKIIKNELLDFLTENKMIKDSQHGFMPGRSTTSNLIEYLDAVSSALDEGLTMCSIYTDYSKCFYFSVEVFAKITSIFYVMTSHRL